MGVAKTYPEFENDLESKVGADDFNTFELQQILSFLNLHLKSIWERTNWPSVCVYGGDFTPDSDNRVADAAIGEVFNVFKEDPKTKISPNCVPYILTEDGIQLLGSDIPTTAYVWYRTIPTVFTEANKGSNTVPYEFYQYCVHMTYASMLRSQGQNTRAAFEEGIADSYLQLELDKLERQQGHLPPITIQTYLSAQA